MSNKTYKVDVDGAFEFEIVLKGHQSFRAEIINTDFQNKTFMIKVNGSVHEVKLADQFDQLVKKLGLSVVTNKKVNDIKAPMPGLVLEVSVELGQEVQKGDGLLILEAMKMENVIKSPGDGVVKAIHADNGTAVDKGQLLIELE